MLEAAADNILQQDFLKAIKQGVKEAQAVVTKIKEMQALYGKQKREFEPKVALDDSISEALQR